MECTPSLFAASRQLACSWSSPSCVRLWLLLRSYEQVCFLITHSVFSHCGRCHKGSRCDIAFRAAPSTKCLRLKPLSALVECADASSFCAAWRPLFLIRAPSPTDAFFRPRALQQIWESFVLVEHRIVAPPWGAFLNLLLGRRCVVMAPGRLRADIPCKNCARVSCLLNTGCSPPPWAAFSQSTFGPRRRGHYVVFRHPGRMES